MRLFRRLVVGLVVIVVAVLAVLALGSAMSLDRDRHHSVATAALPLLDATTRAGLVPDGDIVRIAGNGFEFRARVAGLDNTGPGVVLLHGFPETSAMWQPLIELLAAGGYRIVAFDQRGYSPGARPDGVAAYEIEHLVADVFAVAQAAGMNEFHLIGHDWGAGVGWAAATAQPERLLSWTSLSIPHVSAFAEALANDPDQRRKSRYMSLFRTPWLPEALLTFNNLALMNNAMYRDMSDAQRAEYGAVFAEPGALTAALNWYRAPRALSAIEPTPKVKLPILFIWGNQDPAVSRAAVDAQSQYIEGAFEQHELDAGHWLMEEATDTVDALILEFLRKTDAKRTAA